MRKRHPLIFEKRRACGFTLIELLVVIAISAVLGILGFAAFSQYNARQAVTQAAQDIQLALQEAKFNAISQVKPTDCISPSNYSLAGYRVQFCAKTPATCLSNPQRQFEINYLCGGSAPNYLLNGIYNQQAKDFRGVSIVTASTTCTQIDFLAVSAGVVGTPCVINLSGPQGQTAIINIDQNGNSIIQ